EADGGLVAYSEAGTEQCGLTQRHRRQCGDFVHVWTCGSGGRSRPDRVAPVVDLGRCEPQIGDAGDVRRERQAEKSCPLTMFVEYEQLVSRRRRAEEVP